MKYTIVFLALFLTACATSAKRLGRLSPGMDKSTVIDVLGDPDSFKLTGDTEVLVYELGDGGLIARNYWVVLKNGRLVQYGRARDFTGGPAEVNVNVNSH